MAKKNLLWELPLLLVLTAAAAVVIYMNNGAHKTAPVPTAQTAIVSTAPAAEESENAPLPTPEETSAPSPTPKAPVPTVFVPPMQQRDFVYTQRSYQAITDILAEFRYNGLSASNRIGGLIEELKDENPEQGAVWENIISYWMYVNTDIILNRDILPDGLPEDESLCIVILGYRLENDGSMSEELVKRCEVGLASAEKYPNAYIAVTGGGTAAQSDATEAEVMADWFCERGIDRERLIIENRSRTTGENAQFTLAILRDSYPDIKSLAIVSSNYHIPEGSMVFYEETQLNAYKYCIEPLNIVSNAFTDMGFSYYGNVHSQASYIWELADPIY